MKNKKQKQDGAGYLTLTKLKKKKDNNLFLIFFKRFSLKLLRIRRSGRSFLP